MQVTGLSKSDLVLHEGNDIVKVGDIEVELLHTPGHTPGSRCFCVKDSLFAGDTLFLQGCGRVDLPGGDADEMYYTLTQRLSKLPDSMTLFPGHAYGGEHAPSATLGKPIINYRFRISRPGAASIEVAQNVPRPPWRWPCLHKPISTTHRSLSTVVHKDSTVSSGVRETTTRCSCTDFPIVHGP